MANVTDKNPIVAETTGALRTSQCVVRAIMWSGCTNTSHSVTLNNAEDGDLVFYAYGADRSISFGQEGFAVSGLYLQAISSGKLIIYLR